MLIRHRVKVRGVVNRYERRIDEIRREKKLYDDKLRQIQKEIHAEKKKIQHVWWWPWGD